MKDTPEKSETHLLLKTYSDMYTAEFHEPAPIEWARDGKLAKELLARYTFAKLAEWLRAFFKSTDPFIRESGYTFPMFKFNLSKLITEAQSHISEKSWRTVTGIFGKPPERTPIRDAVYFLSTSFRAEMDMPQTRSYERTLAELKDQPEILMRAAEILVDEAANGRQFYPLPKPSDVKGACAKVIEVLRLKEFALAIEVCDHDHKGWEEITRPDGSTHLQRCSHWRMGRERMNAIAKPLALPAHTDHLERITPEVA